MPHFRITIVAKSAGMTSGKTLTRAPLASALAANLDYIVPQRLSLRLNNYLDGILGIGDELEA